MPVGDCQRAFGAAAEADGLLLGPSRLPWINQRGHLGLPPECRDAIAPLDAIFAALGGDRARELAKRTTPLTGDFVELGTGTLIEVDESQHFTSFRAISLELYPTEVRLGFDRGRYLELCRELAPRSDRYRANRDAVGFGPGGRQRQRAYHDALRDIATPVRGRPPVIRVAVLDGDGAAAYRRERKRIRHLLDDARSRDQQAVESADGRAKVVTLCGSTRFEAEFAEVNERLTLEGCVVISLGMFRIPDVPDYDWAADSSNLKERLGRVQFQKIRMADEVYVVDPGGYVGESTRREIAYAESLGKPVRYLSRERLAGTADGPQG